MAVRTNASMQLARMISDQLKYRDVEGWGLSLMETMVNEDDLLKYVVTSDDDDNEALKTLDVKIWMGYHVRNLVVEFGTIDYPRWVNGAQLPDWTVLTLTDFPQRYRLEFEVSRIDLVTNLIIAVLCRDVVDLGETFHLGHRPRPKLHIELVQREVHRWVGGRIQTGFSVHSKREFDQIAILRELRDIPKFLEYSLESNGDGGVGLVINAGGVCTTIAWISGASIEDISMLLGLPIRPTQAIT